MKHILTLPCILRTVIAVFIAMAGTDATLAQVLYPSNYTYNSDYEDYEFTPRLGATINGTTYPTTHWTKWREELKQKGVKFEDTFDETTTYWDSDPNNSESAPIQATHTFIDTLYVKKGQWIKLLLPNTMDQGNSTYEAGSRYIRWYSYRTNSSLTVQEGGNTYELLLDGKNPDSKNYYKTSRGYFSGTAFGKEANANMSSALFYYPTDDEFEKWDIANHGTGITNSHYVIVCDVTMYSDETIITAPSGGWWGDQTPGRITEPTLSQRAVFFISGIDEDKAGFEADFTSQEYGKIPFWNFVKESPWMKSNMHPTKDDPWYEEYEIDFPYRRFYSEAGGSINAEMLVLKRDARYSFLPGSTWGGDLKVTLDPGNSGIRFHQPNTNSTDYDFISPTEIHVKGGGSNNAAASLNRIMPFDYPNTNANSNSPFYKTQTVNAVDSYAYIYVQDANSNFNLVRYKLNFRAGNLLLAQKDLDAIADGTAPEELKRYEPRTPEYLEKNYQRIASLNFDLPNDLDLGNDVVKKSDGTNKYYPFPRRWERSGYGFYDGSTSVSASGDKKETQWGHYGIVSDYIWDKPSSPTTENPNPDPTPTKRPSNYKYWLYIDASDLPSEVAQLSFENQRLCHGSELFISAFLKNGKSVNISNGNKVDDFAAIFTVIGEKTENGKTVSKVLHKFSTGQVPRTALMADRYGGQDYWIQAYSSFIMGSEDFDHYYLQIDNNAYSSNGADFYIDHVNVYMNSTSVEAKQISPTCSSTNSKMRILVNYDKILSRLGMTEKTADSDPLQTSRLSFAFVDTLELAQAGQTSTVPAQLLKPFNLYKGHGTQGVQDATRNFFTLHFSNDFKAMHTNQPYRENFSSNKGEAPDTVEVEEIDETTGLPVKRRRPFWRAWQRTNPDGSNGSRYLAIDVSAPLEGGHTYYLVMNDLEEATFSVSDVCDIFATFKVTSTSSLKVNGEVSGTDADYCAGQIRTFSVDLTAFIDGNEQKVPEQYNYFDWYIGSLDDYKNKNLDPNGDGSPFTLYNAVDALRQHYPEANSLEGVTAQPETEARLPLTEEMIHALRNAATPADGSVATLYLRQKELSVRVENGMGIVAHPIPFVMGDLGDTSTQSYLLCFDPVAMTLTALNNAPEVNVGFDDNSYPATYNPAIRLGLQHLGTNKNIQVPLRGLKHSDENAPAADHLTPVAGQTDLYVAWTDDPLWNIVNMYEHTVGSLQSLRAYFGKEGNYATITLNAQSNTGLKLREGFTYNLVALAREGTGEASTNCYATIFMPVKIVPEHLRWLGKASSNWNDDSNWRRSTKGELFAANYEDYADAKEENFAPMYFSKITLPKASQMHTYAAGTKGNGNGENVLDLTVPAGSDIVPAQSYIEYDLEVRENGNSLAAYPYENDQVAEVHLEPRAELLGRSFSYDRLWTDYLLKTDEWHLLASPLPDVVAGDFYAPKANGRQETPYFSDITFDPTNYKYDRFGPAIYQRNWGDEQESTNYEVYNGTGTKPMNIASSQWSAAFNDMSVPYAVGTGFSLKPTKGRMTVTPDSVLVRLPKQDGTYYYFKKNSDYYYGQDYWTDVFRVNDKYLSHGTSPSTAVENVSEVKLTAKSQYLLLGNPYLSSLDMKKVMALNSDLFEQKYWTLDKGKQTAAITTDNDKWTSTNADGSLTVGPRQGFIVKLKTAPAASGTEVTFKFNASATSFANNVLSATTSSAAYSPSLRRSSTIALLPIGGSVATVNVKPSASEGFLATEDAELLLDTNLGNEGQVQAYTSAGNRATSINSTPSADNIPVGILGRRGESVKVSISGAEGLSLYDAVTRETTPLSGHTTEVEMEGDAIGRYFLRSSSASIDDAAPAVVSATALGNGRLVVSTTGASLGSVAVYSSDGRLAARADEPSRSHMFSLTPGIYAIVPAGLKVRVE